MVKQTRILSILLLLALLLLSGCFREASPGLEPTADLSGAGAQDDDMVATATLTPDVLATPFVTPFTPGVGVDPDALPTLAEPSATLELLAPEGEDGAAAEGEGDAAADGEAEAGTASPLPAAPQVTNTAPFAAGPTFTPLPGAPTLDPDAGLQPTPTLPPPGSIAGTPTDDPCVYVVQPGDSAFYIATLNGITLDELIDANSLQDPNYLYEGQELRIPGCGANAPGDDGELADDVTDDGTGDGPPPVATTPPPAGTTIHVVLDGQNLYRISLQYGVTVDDIVQANGFSGPDVIIHPGDELIIPVPAQ
ncbi:MAG: LysM peptidoglycan-binding domain-containing protein [Anaerolineae bacterium]|nr:LysM peptidoglycan-binding domain-containing protein [Anaerolineae bacterium]